MRCLHLWSILLLLPVSLSGCSGDVGPCNDVKLGRDTVVSGGQVVYAGQAILNQACATACHASGAKGIARKGVPKGLDFDLQPVSEEDIKGTRENKDGVTVLRIDSDALGALRKRRNAVFQQRNSLWQQVEDGLMPPSGGFVELLTSVFASPESAPCERGRALSALDDGDAREVLRNWLACGAPIVEAHGAEVEQLESVGTVGYQYPACEAPAEATLEDLLAGPLSGCKGCHPTLVPPDFTSAEKVMATVLSNSDEICNGKPYVTPGDPDNSFLYDLVALDSPGCKQDRMPPGGPYLSESDLAQVAEWITNGAP